MRDMWKRRIRRIKTPYRIIDNQFIIFHDARRSLTDTSLSTLFLMRPRLRYQEASPHAQGVLLLFARGARTEGGCRGEELMTDFHDTNLVRRNDGAYELQHTTEQLPAFRIDATQASQSSIHWNRSLHTMEISIKPTKGLKIHGAKIRIRKVDPRIVTDDNGKTWQMDTDNTGFVARKEPYVGILSVVETERGFELRFQVTSDDAPNGDSLAHLFLQS